MCKRIVKGIMSIFKSLYENKGAVIFVLFIISFCVNMYTFADSKYQAQLPVTVEGIVLLDGKICTNATVVIGDKNTTSSNDGSFTLQNIPRGTICSKIIINNTKMSEKPIAIKNNPEFVTLQTIDYSKSNVV